MADNVVFPQMGRGRPTAAKRARYDEQARVFCEYMLKIASTLDFMPSSRGWCYVMENDGKITKGQFDAALAFITSCRKSGLLPVDICSEDDRRAFLHLPELDAARPVDFVSAWVNHLRSAWRRYTPIDFWSLQDVYVEMLVEKSDLASLFAPVCAEYHVPLANTSGRADVHQRYAMLQRFGEHAAAGRQCVLLYCGDHDPAGLAISDELRGNFDELAEAAGWHPDELVIDRFGLNYEFIVANGLSWVDNLETSSGKRLDDPRHPDFGRDYVQSYLSQFGARKVEANALVVRPQAGRELCRQAILRWLDGAAALQRYEDALRPLRERVRLEIGGLLAGGGGL